MSDDQSVRQRWRSGVATQMRAQQLRQERTPAEALLWERLRNRQIDGFKFRRQHPIGRFIADFCCAEKQLVLEIDGAVHDRQEDYDQARTEALQAAGYQIIRYTNQQIDRDIDAVLADLRRNLRHADRDEATPSPAAAGEGDGG
jgi:very-short-patch-repair endonuclease